MGEAATRRTFGSDGPGPRPGRQGRPGRHGRPPAAPIKRRRVLIADARENGTYLRTTWHADRRMFVVSTWNDEVCLGAIRVPVEDAAELMSLLMDGLVEHIGDLPVPDVPPAAPRSPLGRSWDLFRDQLRAWARVGAGKAASMRNLRLTTEPPPTRNRPRRSA